MIAESAVIGRRVGLVGFAISMITTDDLSGACSLTQMNLWLSMVRVAKPIFWGLIPKAVSYTIFNEFDQNMQVSGLPGIILESELAIESPSSVIFTNLQR